MHKPHGTSSDGERVRPTTIPIQLKKIWYCTADRPGRRAPPSIARYPWHLERGPGEFWPLDPSKIACMRTPTLPNGGREIKTTRLREAFKKLALLLSLPFPDSQPQRSGVCCTAQRFVLRCVCVCGRDQTPTSPHLSTHPSAHPPLAAAAAAARSLPPR